jgi:cobalamin synthase
MNKVLQQLPEAFRFAVQFLTRIPLGKHVEYQPKLAGAAVAWYGVVGLLMGCVLAISGWVLTDWIHLPSLLVAAIVLIIWVVITGALHLDGVGDCGDAWMGGHTPERMLEIMKDTRTIVRRGRLVFAAVCAGHGASGFNPGFTLCALPSVEWISD